MKRAISVAAALALATAPTVAGASAASSLSVAKAGQTRAATPAAKKNRILGSATPVFVGLLILGLVVGITASTGADSP